MPGDGRLRLTLLGGFLGAGKTTWLRHQLHVGRFGAAHVLVNEAAEVAVDDALLDRAAGLGLLAGGCCCCQGRPALLAALRALCDQRSRNSAPGQVVLETSGLADPAAILAAIQADPVLVHHIVLEETVVLVDALHGLAQLTREPLGRRQVAAADHLILTKVDAAPPEALTQLRAALLALNPLARHSAAAHGLARDLPAFCGTPTPLPALRDGDPIFATPLRLDPGIDWAGFVLWLSALLHARGEDLMRVKGVLPTPAGRLLLQTVRRVVQSPEILPPGSAGEVDGTLVFIGRGFRPEDLGRSLRRFVGA